MEDLFLQGISQYGFPIAMCFYLMARVIKAVDRNTTAIDSLREDIRHLIQRNHL